MRSEFKGLVGVLVALLAGCGGPTPLVTPDGGDKVAANNPAPTATDSNERKLAILNGQMVTVIDPTPQDVQTIKEDPAPDVSPSMQSSESIASVKPAEITSQPLPVEMVQGLTPFTAESGASLKNSLGDWLQANGWRLSWRAEGSSPGRVRDFRLSEPVSISTSSIPNLLNQLLPGRGLHAIVSNKSKAVLIENDANALPRAQREE